MQHPEPRAFHLAQVLRALGDPARLAIVRRLAESGGLSCGVLGDDRPKSSMSHHFRVLREAGIILSVSCGPGYTNTLRRTDLDQRFPGLLTAVLEAGGEG